MVEQCRPGRSRPLLLRRLMTHVEGRESILAAFNRSRAPPPQPRPKEQPRPAARQAQPEPEISEAAYDEFCAGFFVGNISWPRKLLGPAPGESGCRVPLAVLKRNRLREHGLQPPQSHVGPGWRSLGGAQ